MHVCGVHTYVHVHVPLCMSMYACGLPSWVTGLLFYGSLNEPRSLGSYGGGVPISPFGAGIAGVLLCHQGFVCVLGSKLILLCAWMAL